MQNDRCEKTLTAFLIPCPIIQASMVTKAALLDPSSTMYALENCLKCKPHPFWPDLAYPI